MIYLLLFVIYLLFIFYLFVYYLFMIYLLFIYHLFINYLYIYLLMLRHQKLPTSSCPFPDSQRLPSLRCIHKSIQPSSLRLHSHILPNPHTNDNTNLPVRSADLARHLH